MTASLDTVRQLAGNAGIDLNKCVTRSEMKRLVLGHYDILDRGERAKGNTGWRDQHDMRLLEALEINSFRS